MILFLTYLCCSTQPDSFQSAIDNINSYYDTCIMIAANPEKC